MVGNSDDPLISTYALSRSGVDLFFKGMMLGLSGNINRCHSCLSSYESLLFAVLAFENVLYEWYKSGLGVDGSYRFFLGITRVYEFMGLVDEACKYKDMANKIASDLFNGYF